LQNSSTEHAEAAEFKQNKRNGIMEQWNNGMVGNTIISPIFHHSNFPFFASVDSAISVVKSFISHESLRAAEGIFIKEKKAAKRHRRPLRIKTEESPHSWAMTPDRIGPRLMPAA